MKELKYYISDGKEKYGPFSLNELKEKVTSRETYVWYEGLDSWELISEIGELKSIVSKIPPSIDSIKQNPPKIKELQPEDIEHKIKAADYIIEGIEKSSEYLELKSKISDLDKQFFDWFNGSIISGKLIDRFYTANKENRSNILNLYLIYANKDLQNFKSAVAQILKKPENMVYLEIDTKSLKSLEEIKSEIEKITNEKFILDLTTGQGALVDFFINFNEEAKPVLIKLYQIYSNEGRLNFKNAISKIYKYDKSFYVTRVPNLEQTDNSKPIKKEINKQKESKYCQKCGSLIDEMGLCKVCFKDKVEYAKKEEKKSISSKPNKRKEDGYKPIKTSLIILSIVDLIVESAISTTIGRTASIPAVIITYLISNGIMRYWYSKNPNFQNKITLTIMVFIGVILAKAIIINLALSLIL